MPITDASTPTAWVARLLDGLAEVRSLEDALRQVDSLRRQVAGDSLFSIQQNVTTDDDPADEVQLRRFYSSESGRFPVDAAKRKARTPWTECLFLHGRVFVGEGTDVLARSFDDFEQMRPFGVRSVINVPLMRANLCYATFNVFGTRDRWLPQEVAGIRVLALATARWVPRAPRLADRFTAAPAAPSLEA